MIGFTEPFGKSSLETVWKKGKALSEVLADSKLVDNATTVGTPYNWLSILCVVLRSIESDAMYVRVFFYKPECCPALSKWFVWGCAVVFSRGALILQPTVFLNR